MKFTKIEYLYLIWVVPLLSMVFIYGMKKRLELLKKYSTAAGLNSIALGVSASRRRIKAGLILLGMFFTVLAMTGPKIGYKWREIERKGVDIIIALDCSKSMLAEDLKPTRLDRAKREVFDLLQMLQGDRIGLVAFAGTAFLQCPLTLDYESFYIFLNALTPDFLPIGGTDIAGAVTTSLSGFNEKSTSDKAIILITDGENTGRDNPIEVAKEANKQGVKLFCIGVGRETGAPIPVKDGGFKKTGSGKIVLTKLDEAMLKKMAFMTEGAYVRSTAGDMDLESIYLGRIRGAMEQETLSSGNKKIWEDRYQWFVALAIFALMLEIFLSSRKKTGMILSILFFILLIQPAVAGNIQDGLDAYEKGDYEKALKQFVDAQLKDPKLPAILYNVGNAYYRLGNFEAAYDHFKQAIQSENTDLKQKSLYNLGNAGYRRGMMEDAIKNYTAALKINPKDEKAKQNLEFVKKMMEEKKRQSSSGNKEETEKKDNHKDPGNQNHQTGGGDKNKDQKDSASNEQDAEKKENQQKESREEESQAGQDSEGKSQQKETARAREAKPQSKKANDQTQRMLNRLQDKPGKAMIPVYRKRHIDKDW